MYGAVQYAVYTIQCEVCTVLEHYNYGVTPEAQLKLLHHSGEGLGHQSNTGVINELDLFLG